MGLRELWSVMLPLIMRIINRTFKQSTGSTPDGAGSGEKQYAIVEERRFEFGSYVLMSYLSRPPSKLHCRWEGPFEVMNRERNNVELRDLTNDAIRVVDVSRLRQFFVEPGVDGKAIARALSDVPARFSLLNSKHYFQFTYSVSYGHNETTAVRIRLLLCY
jgi:hypothetical protein